MICDVCKREIKRDMKNKMSFWQVETFWYIQEKIQDILFNAQDRRTRISRYLGEDQIKILRNMLDEIELIIGKVTPYIEAEV